jgi:hypothetical protein
MYAVTLSMDTTTLNNTGFVFDTATTVFTIILMTLSSDELCHMIDILRVIILFAFASYSIRLCIMPKI